MCFPSFFSFVLILMAALLLSDAKVFSLALVPSLLLLQLRGPSRLELVRGWNNAGCHRLASTC